MSANIQGVLSNEMSHVYELFDLFDPKEFITLRIVSSLYPTNLLLSG